MHCLITGCTHNRRGRVNGKSWQELQVCACCANELYPELYKKPSRACHEGGKQHGFKNKYWGLIEQFNS